MEKKERENGKHWGSWLAAMLLSAVVGAGAALGVVQMNGFPAEAASAKIVQAGDPAVPAQPAQAAQAEQGNVSDRIIEAAKTVKPAIVVVVNYVPGGSGLKAQGEGSGIIYDNQGYIVTNNHVVEGAAKLEVLLPNGKNTEAKLIGRDPYSDLAVLQIPAAAVTGVAELGDSDKLQVGEPAIAIGSPLGQAFNQSVTVGVISGTKRMMPVTDEATGQFLNEQAVLQTDAAINPGNSGGALCNIEGKVIGVNSSKIATEGVEGMGFAIPINEARQIIDQLRKNGKVSYPALGIQAGDLQKLTASYGIQAPVNYGVVVAAVLSPEAKQAGLEKGDIVTSMDNVKITDSVTLHAELFKHKIGDSVALKVYKPDGSERTLNVTLTALPAPSR
ncbi:trypsin-like peptidase domain-containing protein [Paenibacillus sp. CC-CFT747]|nr:trypsin-like peptidase domain-containing protein [Paenibacillus sp. CC-CFT747]